MSQIKVNSIVPASGLSAGANGGIIQTVQTVKTDTTSTTSQSATDMTGASVTITPSSSSNKIVVTVDLKLGTSSNGAEPQIRLYRVVGGSATQIFMGDADGNRSRVMFGGDEFSSGSNAEWMLRMASGTFLDSPGTTSAVTYKIQWNSVNSGYTLYLNRPGGDSNNAAFPRAASSITAMEVSA